jgi:hypothetical protein
MAIPAIVELKTGPSLLTMIGIPLRLLLVNRLPFVFSLHRGHA